MDGADSTRRAVLRRAALVATGAAAGAATFAETTHYADRHLPLASGPASGTWGNRQQSAGAGDLQIVWSVRTDSRLIALTFDDGPRPQWTPMVLDTLDRYEVPATFFMVGERVRAHADLIRGRLLRHEVASHSWAHHDLARMDAVAVQDDLRRTHDTIADVTGREPKLLRPPYGHFGGSTALIAARLGYRLVLWSLQMIEGTYPDDPAGLARYILDNTQPGTILLAHDTGPANRLVALHGLPDMITGLRARGYQFVTVSELLAAQAKV